MTARDYIEVTKPRIVVVLVITAVASLLAASRFDSTPNVAWDVSAWQIGFLTLAGALASMGASALNHYYDRDIDKNMERTARRPIPAGRLPANRVFTYGARVVYAFYCHCLADPESCCHWDDCYWNLLLRGDIHCLAQAQ